MPGNRTSLNADAVLFATTKISVIAIECIASLGLKITDDGALVSFDNADAYKICISCNGPLDSKKGRIYSPPNLQG